MHQPGRSLTITSTVFVRVSELKFVFSRSGGPGGQHVNKVSSKVELLFDVAKSRSLNQRQIERLRVRLGSRIGADGILRLSEQSSRSQWRNRQKAIERFQQLLRTALREQRKRIQTGPTPAAREERLRTKQLHARKKGERRATLDE